MFPTLNHPLFGSLGFVTLPVTNVWSRNPAQTWLTLQPPAGAESLNPTLLSPSESSVSFLSGVANNGSGGSLTKAGSTPSVVGGTGVQLRVSVRYKSVDVLPLSTYLPLHTVSSRFLPSVWLALPPLQYKSAMVKTPSYDRRKQNF